MYRDKQGQGRNVFHLLSSPLPFPLPLSSPSPLSLLSSEEAGRAFLVFRKIANFFSLAQTFRFQWLAGLAGRHKTKSELDKVDGLVFKWGRTREVGGPCDS